MAGQHTGSPTAQHLDECIRICLECARWCEQCGAECMRMAAAHEGDMQTVLRHSADVCRRCAESCREMAAMAPAS